MWGRTLVALRWARFPANCLIGSAVPGLFKMSTTKLSFRARALDAAKPMAVFMAHELPDLPDFTIINRAVPQMPTGMEKEEETVRRFSHNRENCKVKMAENGLAAMFDAFELLAPISKLYSVLFTFFIFLKVHFEFEQQFM